MLILLALMLVMAAASIAVGAVDIPPSHIAEVLWSALTRDGSLAASRDALILLDIRIPRTLLGLLVGAALAVSGALLQGLFRNPLADPGLVGVSAGAALAASAAIVLGDRLFPGGLGLLADGLPPLAAFLGGLTATLLLYALATRSGRTSVATLLLAGVALGALAGALTGLLVYLSNDRQLRDLTFWSLGSLGGATWAKVVVAAVLVLPVIAAVPLMARSLNALALGEAEAYYLGVPVQRTKRILIGLVSLAVGGSVALAGPIAFVGIVVPHVLRLSIGADHRLVLPASALLGGSLLVAADILARTLAAPAEVPIGILTAAIGAPFFLWLLFHRAREFGS
jgi:iron complex transport system permease protein